MKSTGFFWLCVLTAVTLILLAMAGKIDMDDTKQVVPLGPPQEPVGTLVVDHQQG